MRFAAVALLIGMLLLSTLPASAADDAPNFTLKNLKGKPVELAEVLKKGPVLLSFWSTWCGNCPAEMTHFQKFYEKYEEQGLTVLAISIDTSKTEKKVKPWIKGRRYTFPVLMDTKNKVMRLYHVGPVPHSFVINQEGKIVYSHVGFRPGDERGYAAAIAKLLPAEKTEKTEK